MPKNRIVFCATCGRPDGEPVDLEGTQAALESALFDAALSDRFSVTYVDCMGACEEPSALAIQGEGRATYLFSNLELINDVTDIIATCHTYLAAPDGWITDAQQCGKLRTCLRARVPSSTTTT